MPTHETLNTLFKTASLSPATIRFLIQKARQLKASHLTPQQITEKKALNKIVALVFFEPSTRTRFSFEIACHRLGLQPVTFSADSTTSLSKGETLSETLEKLLAMRPDALVIRYAGEKEIADVCLKATCPIVNAGEGTREHPTQALLDAMTIEERLGSVEGQKILFVGDVAHSRVAHSGLEVFQKLGATVGFCAPKEFWPKADLWSKAQSFEKMAEATKWATVCIGLRLQKERHQKSSSAHLDNYIENYRLDAKNLQNLSATAVIMHPGPAVLGEDLHPAILQDPRCAIDQQVTNGVYIRMSVLGEILGLFNS
jgi:aspartate carbamoyltransferase catalytic subunit